MKKNRLQSPPQTFDPLSREKCFSKVMPKSPLPSPRAGIKPIGLWTLSASEKKKKLSEDEWFKILKACNAPIGFTHNDLALHPKPKVVKVK